MITLNKLTMNFTQRTLFQDVTLSVFRNEKIGLTGPNGAGKTTLFSVILGEIEPMEGNVQIQKNIKIGYLPQEVKFQSERTVLEEITEGDDHIRALMQEKRNLEDAHKADTPRYGDILEELEQCGIYELEHKAEKILSGLGFKEEGFHRPVSELSGGWQMRTLLAKLLTYPYDLLLLDEPTNYLDLSATLWLKDFLKEYKGSFLLISHDRVFLNDVTNYTIVLANAQMMKVKGNYEVFEAQKAAHLKTMEKKQKVVEKKRQQLERFTQRFHAQPNLAAAVRNKRRMIERLEKFDISRDKKSISEFKFPEITPSGYMVVNCKNIDKSYGDKHIYHGLNLEIIRGQRICLVGPNGAGKSTLLKMLAGVLSPNSGEIHYGHKVDKGYFSQTRLDVLNPQKTAFEEVTSSGASGTSALQVRSLLGLFNFLGDDVFKYVKILSGGEKSRLILAKLLINPPNFMLLDEPTTHLDLDGVKALTEAIKSYSGTTVFISHDLYFIKEVANCIIEVGGGSLKTFLGGADYYLEKKEQGQLGEKMSEGQQNEKDKLLKKKKKRKEGDSNDSPTLRALKEKHKTAKKRLAEIKRELKQFDEEYQNLEMESYVKARVLSRALEKRDSGIIKEYGKRMKEIQTRLREIESTKKKLVEEREKISK